ncbi:sensor histidine kinase [Derxia gummosa]|uniref:histidine kinase n=1 Tax=Derxia gummosa DSM 723 TaxID=1121388 RepID=A0A8B6X8M1_9BURK|nr:HAMP domain-containing sensor histidine kinase [Derxia gummosa]
MNASPHFARRLARRVLAQLGLSARLCIVFTVLLAAASGGTVIVQMRLDELREQEIVQRLSAGLATHIAGNAALMRRDGLDPVAVRELFAKFMDVNPAVEVYLLDLDGRIIGHAAPPGRLRLDRVDLGPVRDFMRGRPMPVLGDDPRQPGLRKVFSAAPVRVDGRPACYVYVVLMGEEHDAIAAQGRPDHLLGLLLRSAGLVFALVLVAGLVALRMITRPLVELTAAVRGYTADGRPAGGPLAPPAAGAAAPPRDEIALLGQTFAQMTARIGEQWRALTEQDEQRRELVANISHDLRTPLTSLHGYLETLLVKADSLPAADRRRYLETALAQSRKVGRLAQELFELARLEYGVVRPDPENFSLAELAHDVLQKFELPGAARGLRLRADIAPGLPPVTADVALIERVLTNLVDNAIRHTPAGGDIELRLRHEGRQVIVRVSDSGPGIAPALRPLLFTRAAFAVASKQGGGCGGLGLVIVRRILELHGSEIRLLREVGRGAVFSFPLAAGG